MINFQNILDDINESDRKIKEDQRNRELDNMFSDYRKSYRYALNVIEAAKKYPRLALSGLNYAIKEKKILPAFEQIAFDSFDKCLLLKENQIWFYDYNQKKLKVLHIEEKMIKNFCFKDGILAIFTENLISNYQLKFE